MMSEEKWLQYEGKRMREREAKLLRGEKVASVKRYSFKDEV